jgi:hypothetical protein
VRTTVDIDDDVLLAAKEIARRRKVAVGTVLSDWARAALTRRDHVQVVRGVPQFDVQPDARPVTLELVNRLRDENG